MSNPVCPHCGANNEGDAAFCAHCGQAVPTGESSGPRFVDDGVLPTTDAGHALKTEQLAKQTKKAAGALLAVGILQLVFGTCILAMGKQMFANVEPGQLVMVLASVYGMGVLYFGLFFWARRSPFPAAIVGLVIYVTMVLLDVLADPTSIWRGIIVKIIIILVLARAISAGAEHRKLLRQIQT